MKNPKISALVICYKQEKLIKRAIDSLLNQKEYLYEICVSDDGSPDKTWEVLQEYAVQHPGFSNCIGTVRIKGFSRMLNSLGPCQRVI